MVTATTVAATPDGPWAAATRSLAHYAGYTGYDPLFLGSELAVPELSPEQRRRAAVNVAAEPGSDPVVLPYTNFSVVVDRSRQLACYTAVNIDGADTVDAPRGSDSWYFDPRIAESEQIGESLYRHNALDRGHLVRRLDPVWGTQALRAEEDTFHFTNCAPQHAQFNRGRQLWYGLEDYILDGADVVDRKVSVFTGPVLGQADPLYKGVRLPLAYWKIVAFARTDGALTTSAYLLEQAALIDDVVGVRAGFDPGVYRITLAELAELTELGLAHLAPAEATQAPGHAIGEYRRIAVNPDYSNVVR